MKASNTASLSDGVNDGIFEQIGVGIWNWSLDEAALWAKPSDELQYYNDQAVDLVGRDTTAGQVLNYVGTRAAGAEASIINSIKGIPSTIYLGAKTVYDHESHKISQLMLNAYTGNDLQVKARLSIEEAKAEEAEKSNSAIWITGLLGIRNNINYVLNPKNKINYIFNTDLSVSEAEQDTTAVITTAMMVYGGAKGLNALKTRLNAARGAAAKGAVNATKWVDEAGNIKWPANRGFAGTPKEVTLKPGTRIDRYGYEGGTFVSPEGTPYANRALALGTESKPYNVYEVVKPLNAQGGKIASWFGQPGGGTQYELGQSISDLLEAGIIKKVGK